MRPDAAFQAVGGVTYEGDLLVMESFPVQLAANVKVRNVTARRIELTFPDTCVVLLRAYRDGRRVWDQASHVLCGAAIQTVVLEPGQTETLRSSTVSARDVLAGRLAEGTVRMAAALHPRGAEIEVDLGEVDLALPPSGSDHAAR